ncbi:MAG: hypothetical protein EOM24_33470, partial [Chloroflexia bacterium]|nr:hypothetical protein [Chloroflexia bacterium]
MSPSLSDVLDRREDLRRHLYVRGFLVTSTDLAPQIHRYPFYGNWDSVEVGAYTIWHHRLQKVRVEPMEGVTAFLVGHAYDPYAMEHDESVILRRIAESLQHGVQDALNLVNDLTGVFALGWVRDGKLDFLLDASGMQYACYGVVDGELVISSHMQLVGDLCDLEQDPYVQRLKTYKWYRFMMGNYLPGDLTSFRELKRVIPNTCVSFADHEFTVRRFYPAEEIAMCRTEAEYQDVM